MESPRKFNDCYFYYYSTCTKGDNCVFRHEPSALGCETMCSAWQQGKCLDKRCKLRHMELRKNRKQIPCYWENQPGGCRKKHCPFMHKNPDARTDGIAPSQPNPQMPMSGPVSSVGEPGVVEGAPLSNVGPMQPSAPAPNHQPVPMLWQHQQQRQVVLDSAILGVLPASADMLGGRRVVGAVEAPNPYAQMPVDPLVVNFEEESDNESAPSSTPTKSVTEDKSQELLLLEKIQAEAAAFYSYEALPVVDAKERKIVRTNLSSKYDRLSLDEIAGKKQAATTERRKSLDFKVLSLEEIRARKKAETIIQTTPITLNLSRKRKLSTQETVTSSGNKIIKVVRSNSIVYKKLDPNAVTNVAESSKTEEKQTDIVENRKRTISELSDAYEIQADELVDNCYEFKRIRVTEKTSKPRLIRNRTTSEVSLNKITDIYKDVDSKDDNDSDTEVQIISVTNMGNPLDIVDLSDDDDVTITDDLPINVPDVVASCHKKVDTTDNLLKDINSVLSGDALNDIDSLLNDSEDTNIDDEL